MPDKPHTPPTLDTTTEFEKWIDQAIKEELEMLEVAARIATITQPNGTDALQVTPELTGSERWLWPWNRAGFLYLERQQYESAATIFTCAYLAAIRFQHVWQYRIHKGMPLCNVAYAYLKAGKPENAGVPALLGLVEDTLTTENPVATANFQNLLASRYSELHARGFVEFVLFVTRRLGILPLSPETVLDRVGRGNVIPLPAWVGTMQSIAAEFAPGTIKPTLEKLTTAWGRLQPIHTQGVTDYRRAAEHGIFSGFIPITRPDAPIPSNAVSVIGPQAGPRSRSDIPAGSTDSGARPSSGE